MRLAYYRLCAGDASLEAQRQAMGGAFDREFEDGGSSSGGAAAKRPGLARLLEQVRSGDTVSVYALDRLGRDAGEALATVKRLVDAGATVDIRGLRPVGRGVGGIVLAVLAQVADMERQRVLERAQAGRAVAQASLKATGRTHRGKASLGRPKAQDAAAVAAWRRETGASIAQTAAQFGITAATVKRYCAAHRAPEAPPVRPDREPANTSVEPGRPLVDTPVETGRPLAESLARFRAAHVR